MIKALIFDFDGLILDTETPHFVSWQEAYQTHGQTLLLERWASGVGTLEVAVDLYAELEGLLGRDIDRAVIQRERRRRHLELIEAESPRPGVETYLAEAKRLGLKLGIASSSPREWVVGHLSRLGLADRFDCIQTASDVEHTKPDPELYQRVLAALGVRPREAIAFEDSPNGVLAAKRAGLFCVAVPNVATCQLPLAGADLRLGSLAELALGDLVAKVG